MTMQPNGAVFSFAPTSLGSAHLLMVQFDNMKLPSPKKAGRDLFRSGRIAFSKVGSLEQNGPRRTIFFEMCTPSVTSLSISSPHLGLRRIGWRLRLRLLFLCPRLRLRHGCFDPRLRLHGASLISTKGHESVRISMASHKYVGRISTKGHELDAPATQWAQHRRLGCAVHAKKRIRNTRRLTTTPKYL